MPDVEETEAARSASIYAGVRFFNSRTFRSWLPWLGMAATFGGGWFASVWTGISEVRQRVVDLQTTQTENFDRLSAAIDTLTAPVEHLPPGKVPRLERNERLAWGQLARAYAATYGSETDKTRKAKREAANDMAEAYQNRIDNGTPPPVAYDEAIRTVNVR